VEILRNNLTVDARSELSDVHVPTLVIHRAEYGLIPASHGRYLAEHIDGAEYVELPGADGPMFWEAADLILGRLRTFIGRDGHASESQFATILFSDIVRSTELAESLGDREWSAVIGLHRTIADDVIEANKGRLVKSTGDGILAVFPDPASALEGAVELRSKLCEMGITVRVGLHSGRIEVADDDDVSGVAVHIAARVMAAAGDGEIVVSRTGAISCSAPTRRSGTSGRTGCAASTGNGSSTRWSASRPPRRGTLGACSHGEPTGSRANFARSSPLPLVSTHGSRRACARSPPVRR
jgi:hypothetical protein